MYRVILILVASVTRLFQVGSASCGTKDEELPTVSLKRRLALGLSQRQNTGLENTSFGKSLYVFIPTALRATHVPPHLKFGARTRLMPSIGTHWLPQTRTFLERSKSEMESESPVDPRRQFGTPSVDSHWWTRRICVFGSYFLCSRSLVHTAPASALSGGSLSKRLEKKELDKPLLNIPPKETEYPAWLEGTWSVKTQFAGFSFPSTTMSKEKIVREPAIPGFQKLSLAFIPDVGSEAEYRVRFRQGSRTIVEDREFNLLNIINGYYKKTGFVDSVTYNAQKDPNRCTIRLTLGASPNAERIELFTNSRESELRVADGSFFVAESIRQVTLGYTKEYGVARQVNGDYQHVWSFTPTDVPGEVKGTISTAAYVPPNEALRFTASGGVPAAENLLKVATEPAVLYSHTLLMKKVDS